MTGAEEATDGTARAKSDRSTTDSPKLLTADGAENADETIRDVDGEWHHRTVRNRAGLGRKGIVIHDGADGAVPPWDMLLSTAKR
jgi:hypothetical protein